MVLPASGQISFANINIELGRNSTASISIDTAESDGYGCIQHCSSPFPNDTRPASVSEWYGYNHSLKATIDSSQYDGPYNTVALACASTVILGTDLWVYSPSGGYYKNTDGLAECCRTCADDGYYFRITTGNYLYVSSCAGTINSCPPPPPPPPPPTCDCIANECSAGCSNAGTICSSPSDCISI